MVVLASECPSDDQPWLITSRAELARDQEELAEAKRTHAATFPTSGTFAAKHKWASQIDQEERYDFSGSPRGPRLCCRWSSMTPHRSKLSCSC